MLVRSVTGILYIVLGVPLVLEILVCFGMISPDRLPLHIISAVFLLIAFLLLIGLSAAWKRTAAEFATSSGEHAAEDSVQGTIDQLLKRLKS